MWHKKGVGRRTDLYGTPEATLHFQKLASSVQRIAVYQKGNQVSC